MFIAPGGIVALEKWFSNSVELPSPKLKIGKI